MIRIGILGGGWRSEFFARIALALPQLFEVVGVAIRNADKGRAFAAKYRLPVYGSFDELLKLPLDYVINVYSREAICEYNRKLMSLGIPVLSETPPAASLSDLEALWSHYCATGAKVQVAEQYDLQPYHRSVQRIVDDGLIGEPSDLVISMIHGYHGINVARRLLGIGADERCEITGRRFAQPVYETAGRNGLVYGGERKETSRDVATLTFESGKVVFYDFSSEQYFSQIRSRYLRLCGDRGEVFGNEVKYITGAGEFAVSSLKRVDLGAYSNLEGFSLRGIMLNDAYLYRNPFEEKTLADGIRLSDDELAMAEAMVRMKTFIDTGEEFYSFADACQDTYLSLLMTQAVETGTPVRSERRAWND